MRSKVTPSAAIAGLPDSVTSAASFDGIKTLAVAFGGMVTSSVNVPSAEVRHSDDSFPRIVSIEAEANSKPLGIYGLMFIFANPGASGVIPAR